jgi:general secretion pathway protein C
MAAVAPQQIRRIGLALTLIAGGLLIAHTINAFVADTLYVIPEGAARSGSDASASAPLLAAYSPAQAMEQIRASGLFVLPPPTETGATGGTTTGRRGSNGPVVRASLGLATKLRLIGTVLGDERGVFAIVEDLASKQQSLYHLHDSVLDLGEVTEIRRNGIVIRQGNVEEVLESGLSDGQAALNGPPGTMPNSQAGAAPTAPLRKTVDRREVEQAMNDLPKLLSQARAVPNTVNGAVNGFRMEYVAPASFYEKIGVQAGDVLQRVNGVDIRDPSTMLSLLQQLKNEQTVKLDLVRNNQRSTITYDLR